MTKLVVLLIIFFKTTVFAIEPQKAIVNIETKQPYAMGDVLRANLIFFPKGDLTPVQIQELSGSVLPGGMWFVGKVSNARESENNQVALVADLLLVAIAPQVNGSAHVIELGGESYPLEILRVNVKAVKTVSDKFLSIDQEISLNGPIDWLLILIFVLLGLIILVGSFFMYKRIRHKRVSSEKQSVDWSEQIRGAVSRRQIENLYAKREQWAGTIVVKEKEVLKFFELMHKHQYKKEWLPEIKKEVEESLSKVKERVGDQLP